MPIKCYEYPETCDPLRSYGYCNVTSCGVHPHDEEYYGPDGEHQGFGPSVVCINGIVYKSDEVTADHWSINA
jgi:hypothetical protein